MFSCFSPTTATANDNCPPSANNSSSSGSSNNSATSSAPSSTKSLVDDDDDDDNRNRMLTNTPIMTPDDVLLLVPPEEQPSRRLQWISIGIVLVSLACRTILPEKMSVTIVADILGTVMTSLASVSRAKAVTPVVSVDFFETGQVWDEPLTALELFGPSQNKNSKTTTTTNTKIIWGYWASYPEGFPFLCQKALESWQVRNPEWTIIMLNDNNFQQYVSVSDLPSTFYSLKVQHRSDIIRLAVLIRYGGIYLDASTLVYKGFDGIWDQLDQENQQDKLLITSLNQLPSVGFDMYNNGLMMTKGLQNPFLVEWRRRILEYSEAPALTQEDMKAHPAFARVHHHWDDPSLGVLGAMVPYHSNLWILNDMIWHNEQNLSQHIVHLPKIRWGFYYHSLPHFFDKLKTMTSEQAQDNSDNPAHVGWSALSLFGSIVKHLAHGFFDRQEIAMGMVENINILKFTSHDMPLVDMAVNKIGLDGCTAGRIFRVAYNVEEFPIQQATLGGVLPAVTVVSNGDESS